ncbi:unnamed protein product [Enterobius vermicularis]|uniref:Reelin domain-containing protein n=1 Tax=Enterobius vermicularis TaxID=51028 RepID=A0A0N4VPT2_ENTVE|nr:unnamed protein product [Enterobius vermicularis]
MRIEKCLLILFLRSLPIFCDISIDFTVVDPACDRLIPTYNNNQVMPFGSSKFRIRVFDLNGIETFEYSNRPLLGKLDRKRFQLLKMLIKNLRLVRVEGDHYTRGQIHARALLFPDRQVGIFQEPLPKYFKLANCSGRPASAVINDNYVTRRHGSVIWKPPDIPKGPILFYASPIKEGTNATNNSLFPVRSHFISPKLGKLQSKCKQF